MASVRKPVNRPRGLKYPRNAVGPSAPIQTPDVEAQVIIDEPTLLGTGENPETDIPSTALSHPIVDRPSSVESDAAPSAIDDALPQTVSADPNVCSERGTGPETAEDLH